MAKLNCAILDDYQDAAMAAADWSVIEDDVSLVRFSDHVSDRERLAQRLESFEIIVAMRERTVFDAALFARLPRLRLLVTTGMANASIDMAAARERGVTVSGTRGSVGPAAELAWGLLLSLMRNIPAENANFHQSGGQWQLSVGRDLMGKTIGVVGLGKLGQKVIGYAKAFAMDVVGWSKNSTPQRCADLGIRYSPTLGELLPQCDVVTLHLTLNDETRGIIGAAELASMKKGSVLINTSRGPLVDEAALMQALETGHLGGAGLDTFEVEPLPGDHPLRGMANVIATPHLGYVTRETYAIYFRDAVEDIRTWLDGAPARVLNG